MSSRQEEKERRKREREEREQAEKASAARRKRLQFVFGGFLVVVVIAAVVVLGVTQLGGGGDSSGDGPAAAKAVNGASIPAARQADLAKAAAAAGCKVVNAANEGATHEDKQFKPSDYKQNPPTSGNHTPTWYEDGIYAAGDTPDLGKTVHPLEHGRIEVQYKPGTPKATVDRLETLVSQSDGGYHMLLFQNASGMPFAVAATAWDHQLGCPAMNDKVFDALRDFRTQFIDKGPEVVP